MNNIVYFKNQSYDLLRQRFIFPNASFLDETFPPNILSVSPSGKIANMEDIEWKRLGEICDKPCLFIDGSSTKDVCQGMLGNCWFVSSMAVLALHPKCLNIVIPYVSDQESQLKDPNKYAGIFRFRFWRYGEWLEVVIDDNLPTRRGKLIFTHSKDVNEFWSALLEKAYAKVCGSYESLIGGQEEEALVDFSGGVPEQIFELKKYAAMESDAESLFKLLELDWKDGSMICASIASKFGEMEERLSNGLVTTHAYSITGVARIPARIMSKLEGFQETEMAMCRIRNPWGQKEWSGAFCDNGNEWKQVSEEEKRKIGLKIENDGEFWMCIKDFLENFNQLTIVRLIKTGILKFNTKWYGSSHRGCWTEACFDRETAIKSDDGSGQLRIDISKPSGDVILVHLLQKCPRMMDTYLALLILKVEHNRQTILRSSKWSKVALEYKLGGSRAICLRYNLPYGTYILKPYPTQKLKNNQPLFYLLRCFTTQHNHFVNLLSQPSMSATCCKKDSSKLISRLRLIQAEVLPTSRKLINSHIFCEITCENKVFRSNFATNSKTLFWDDAFLFYRSYPEIPIVVCIIEAGQLMNTTLGYVIYKFDLVSLNTADVISSTDPVLEKDLVSLSKTINCLQVQWYHTDNVFNL